MSNHKRIVRLLLAGWGGLVLVLSAAYRLSAEQPIQERPNILLAISDNHSWPHASCYGCKFVNTPALDRLAREGILFTGGFAPAPSCSPARATLLTGRNIWQIQEAGVHGSLFPAKFPVITHLLEQAGYSVGYTGKGWGPGDWSAGGPDVARTRDPVGKCYNKRRLKPPARQKISSIDYTANFAEFLEHRRPGQPFFFWYGGIEPHRPYTQDSPLLVAERLEDVEVPPFLPDCETVRRELLAYALEIEWFDRHLGRMVAILEESRELDNTIVVVTADQGMHFPRAIMHAYEFGTHVPLVVRWGARIPGGRVVDDLVSFIDFAPTFLEAAQATRPVSMSGRSLMNVFLSAKSGLVDPTRVRVLTGKERHSCARPGNACYPTRTIRTLEYLYLRNFKPDRWPAGDPPHFLDMHWWLVHRNPTADYILENRDDPKAARFFRFHTAKRPAEELYDIRSDPGCLNNLADDPKYAEIRNRLWSELKQALIAQEDPRVLGRGDSFDSSPMFFKGNIHPETGKPLFPGVAARGAYNTHLQVFDHSQDKEKAQKLNVP